MRIDRLLCFLRLTRTRSLAAKVAAAGHLRIDGQRVTSAHAHVSPGAILTLPTPRGVRVLRIVSLPTRRGPASEARAHYEELGEDADGANDSHQSARY